MKRLSRLTALLLAIIMLCTMFASAESGTSGGVSVEDWTLSDYQRAVETASEETAGGDMEDPWGLVGECGDDNIYCVYARELIALGSAQERYERMMELGSDPEDETALEFTMLHYFGIGEHNKTGVLCTCNYPAYEPEYVPGDVSLHDAACPWHFANLTAAEQYEVVEPMELEAQLPCFAVLTLRQAADLAVYADTQEEGYLSFPCSDENEYCVEIRTVLANMTATEIYDYLTALYYEGLEEGEEGPSAEYVALMLHYGEYHLADELVCTCGEHPVLVPETEVGDISLHEETCPWHFANLTAAEQVIIYYGLKAENQKNYFKFLPVEEQYLIIKDLPAEEQAEYTVTLSKAQYEALMAYMDSAVGVNSPDEEVKDEIAVEGTTASITVPQGTFETDYIMNTAPAAMTEAEQTAIDALGDVHVLAAFNISFTDANDSSVKLQPIDGKTVELTFTIDVTAVEGNTIQIYHLADNGDGTYTAEPVGNPVSVDKTQATQTITVQASAFSTYFTGESCDGTACGTDETTGEVVCSYKDIENKSAEEVHVYLNALYSLDADGSTLGLFLAHLHMYHSDALSNVCICGTYPLPAPGAAEHDIIDCPWHPDNYDPTGASAPVTVSADGAYLMCEGEELAIINDNGYIIDIATGIAVGIYDETNDTITLGVN